MWRLHRIRILPIFPVQLRNLCHSFYQVVVKRFPDEAAAALGTVLFLRFVNPTLGKWVESQASLAFNFPYAANMGIVFVDVKFPSWFFCLILLACFALIPVLNFSATLDSVLQQQLSFHFSSADNEWFFQTHLDISLLAKLFLMLSPLLLLSCKTRLF